MNTKEIVDHPQESKTSRFVYNHSLFDQDSNRSSSSRYLSPICSPSISLDLTPSINNGNSARFYKALKDFQQYSDCNILKEELWASRKEITGLEKKVFDLSQELSGYKKPNYISQTDLQKSLLEEIYQRKELENENSKLKSDLEKLNSKNSFQNLNRVKSVFEFSLKKLGFEFEEKLGKVGRKIKENELKVKNIYESFNSCVFKLLSDIKDDSQDIKFEAELKKKSDELSELKKEFSKTSRASGKRIAELEAYQESFNEKLAQVQDENRENIKINESIKKENKLLNEINRELEKEHLAVMVYVQQLKGKIETLSRKNKKANTVQQKVSLLTSKLQDKEKDYEALMKKYKSYKDKCKKPVKSDNSESNQKLIESYNEIIETKTKENEKLEEKLKKMNKELINLQNYYRNLEEKCCVLESQLAEKNENGTLSEDYQILESQFQKLLIELKELKSNNESNLINHKKFAEIEEKSINLETELIIQSSKLQKYKSLLDAHNISVDASSKSSEISSCSEKA